jgi:hypothetical protein
MVHNREIISVEIQFREGPGEKLLGGALRAGPGEKLPLLCAMLKGLMPYKLPLLLRNA